MIFNWIEVILGLSGNDLVLMLFIDIIYKPVAYIVELRLRQDNGQRNSLAIIHKSCRTAFVGAVLQEQSDQVLFGLIKRIYHRSPMQTEKSQPEGKQIMLETRFTKEYLQ